MEHTPFRVAALYQFTRFDDLPAIRAPLMALCEQEQVKGTLLLANEGINGTIAGKPAAINVPEWPAYNLTDRPSMRIDTQCEVLSNRFSEELTMWRAVGLLWDVEKGA